MEAFCLFFVEVTSATTLFSGNAVSEGGFQFENNFRFIPTHCASGAEQQIALIEELEEGHERVNTIDKFSDGPVKDTAWSGFTL